MLGSPLKITKENKKIFTKSVKMVVRNGDLILFDKKDNEFNLGNISTYCDKEETFYIIETTWKNFLNIGDKIFIYKENITTEFLQKMDLVHIDFVVRIIRNRKAMNVKIASIVRNKY